jgi:uncharacterized repeat protein (TIGR04138 family)
MSPDANLEDKLLKLVRGDPRYGREAYIFIYEALDYAIQKLGEKRHLTGQELLDRIRELAIDKFGLLARNVFESWGVFKCEDFGEIVFNLVEAGLLSKTERDSREDFAGGYDFCDAFDHIPIEAKIQPR